MRSDLHRTLIATSLIFVVMALGLLGGSQITMAAWAKGADRYSDLDTFAQAMHHIERHFVDEIDPTKLIYGAIQGMTKALDKHSTFLEPSEMSDTNIRTEGWYSGVGIEIAHANNKVVISRVIPDSPADMSGVTAGDGIISVNETPIHGLTLTDIGALLQGAEGTVVRISLQRDQTHLDVQLTRYRVRDKAVRISLISPGWAVATITHFQRNTATDLAQGLRQSEADGGQPLRGLVIDFRDNPGGLLDEAVAIVDLFLNDGLIYESRGRGEVVIDTIHAQPGSPWPRLALAILVNHGSASASEIVAGALQGHHRATIVGTRTYGKGSVQRLYVFEDNSALKLTVSRYYLTEGKTVDDNIGIVPDFEVVFPNATDDALEQLTDLLDTLPEAKRPQADTALNFLRENIKPTAPSSTLRLATVQQRLTHDPQLRQAWKIIQNTH
jgi:carboxyl-terminal processing protease